MTKKHKKSDLCPLCGEFLDLYCTGHRKLPFVDNKCYGKLCFTCYNVPKTEKHIYNEDGEIEEVKHLPFSHKHLHTAKELFDAGVADTKTQAQKSITAVRAAIRATKLPRKAPDLKKPTNPGLELTEEE